MNEFEKQKKNIQMQLKSLCAHCSNEVSHNCKVQEIVSEVSKIAGIPLIVNSRFNGLLFVPHQI